MARPPSSATSGVSSILTFVLGWCFLISLIAGLHLMSSVHGTVARHARASFAGVDQQHHQHAEAAASVGHRRGCRPLPDLGFDYPPLRPARAALAALACAPPLPQREVEAAYARALDQLDPSSGWALDEEGPAAAGEEEQQRGARRRTASSDDGGGGQGGGGGSGGGGGGGGDGGTPPESAAALARFLSAALGHVAAEGHVLPCRRDPTLWAAWYGDENADGSATSITNSSSSIPRNVLFATNLVNAGHAAPNLIVQVLRLALALAPPRGRLAISVLESGSSDLTRQWLSLLRMLLAPLRVDARIALDSPLRRPPRGDRIAFMAALRNAVLEPFLPPAAAAAAAAAPRSSGGSGGDASSDSSGGSGGDGGGSSDSSDAGKGWVPDAVLFANDVFFCARDALRLLLHGADLACGLDFYAAPWQARGDGEGVGERGKGGRVRRGDSSGADDEDEAEDAGSAAVLAVADAAEGNGSSDDEGPAARRRALLGGAEERQVELEQQQAEHQIVDNLPTEQQQQQQQQQPAQPLRFYDKWVARDVTGARLRNLPPYAAHGPSAARLRAGLPFPAVCCWNGLAALRAAPLAAGLRFRTAAARGGSSGGGGSQPSNASVAECRASECSLLCDDLHRRARPPGGAGARVVIDAGVRVAYEWEQALALAALERGGDDSSGSSSSRAATALGPPSSWAEAAAATKRDHGAKEWAPRLGAVECCDLPPGKAYVDFRRDCRRVNVLAGSGEAAAAAAGA